MTDKEVLDYYNAFIYAYYPEIVSIHSEMDEMISIKNVDYWSKYDLIKNMCIDYKRRFCIYASKMYDDEKIFIKAMNDERTISTAKGVSFYCNSEIASDVEQVFLYTYKYIDECLAHFNRYKKGEGIESIIKPSLKKIYDATFNKIKEKMDYIDNKYVKSVIAKPIIHNESIYLNKEKNENKNQNDSKNDQYQNIRSIKEEVDTASRGPKKKKRRFTKLVLILVLLIIIISVIRNLTIKTFPFGLKGTETIEEVRTILKDLYGPRDKDGKIKSGGARFCDFTIEKYQVRESIKGGWVIRLDSKAKSHISSDDAFKLITRMRLEYGDPYKISYTLREGYENEKLSYDIIKINNKDMFKDAFLNKLYNISLKWKHMQLALTTNGFWISIFELEDNE